MTLIKSTGDEAANRLGRGEIVEWCGQRLKLIDGVIHFETELTRCWEPSKQFAKMSDVWSVADGWMVTKPLVATPGPDETVTIFGRKVYQLSPGTTDGWETHVGPFLTVAVEPWPGDGFGGRILARLPFIENDTCVDCDCDHQIIWSLLCETKEEAVRWAEDEVRKLIGESAQAAGGEVTWDTKHNGEAS